MRYVTKRTDASGVRYYWQRKGFAVLRLPGDEISRVRVAHDLNAAADSGKTIGVKSKYDPKWWRRLYASCKSTAARRGLGFELTWADLEALVVEANGACIITGLPFIDAPAAGRFGNPYQPSLDRIDSSGPYSRQNCRVVCLAANVALNHWGDDVLRAVSQGILSQYLKRTKAA